MKGPEPLDAFLELITAPTAALMAVFLTLRGIHEFCMTLRTAEGGYEKKTMRGCTLPHDVHSHTLLTSSKESRRPKQMATS